MNGLPIVVQLFILIVFAVVGYTCFIRAGFSLAPWVPTSRKDLVRLQSLIRLQPGQKFYEIGCGDGRVSLAIAQKNPEATITGIEMSPLMYLIAKIRVLFSGAKNIKILSGDALKMDLRDADVLYVYGLPQTVNEKLIPKVQRELKPGGKLVSYAFVIHGENVTADRAEGGASIYVYTRK